MRKAQNTVPSPRGSFLRFYEKETAQLLCAQKEHFPSLGSFFCACGSAWAFLMMTALPMSCGMPLWAQATGTHLASEAWRFRC